MCGCALKPKMSNCSGSGSPCSKCQQNLPYKQYSQLPTPQPELVAMGLWGSQYTMPKMSNVVGDGTKTDTPTEPSTWQKMVSAAKDLLPTVAEVGMDIKDRAEGRTPINNDGSVPAISNGDDDKKSEKTMTYIAYGVGAVILILVGIVLWKKFKK